MIYKSENLVIEAADNGSILTLRIREALSSGFPGKLTASDGIIPSAVWSSRETHLVCELELKRVSGRAEDGAWVRFRIPYPEQQARLNVWTARSGYPKSLYDVGGLNLFYGDVCYGTVMPVATLYDPLSDTGLTVAKALGRIGGRLSFHFDDYHGDGMEIEFSCLEVKIDSPVKLTLLLRAHEGCWRPGLRWFSEQYPEYFEPVNTDIWSYPSFAVTNPLMNPQSLKKHHPDWVEIHNHFPHYGDYLPETPEWDSVIAHDYPNLAAGRSLTISRGKIRNFLKALHSENICGLLYFQCGGDGFQPWAEKDFPDSIARDSAGHPFPTWKECVFMNASPETSYGKFLRNQLKQILNAYPEIDGIFADQVCYQTLDWAHSDGHTALNGREISEYGVSIENNLRLLSELIHSHGKPILGNGPFDLEIARYVDAIMSEGTGGYFESFKYLCIRKPMLIHAYPLNAFIAESIMRCCLLSGAGWSLGGSSTLPEFPEWTQEIEDVYEAYLPLARAVFGAEILLTPNPVTAVIPCAIQGIAPDGPSSAVKTEIFRSRQTDEYLLSVVLAGDMMYPEVKLCVMLPEACTKAFLMKVGESEWSPLKLQPEKNSLIFTLSGHFHACVVRFTKGLKK